MRSDFLFAQPSFFTGMARTLDIGATFDVYNVSATTQQADARAIFSDWRMVGQDLAEAMDAFQGAPPPTPTPAEEQLDIAFDR